MIFWKRISDSKDGTSPIFAIIFVKTLSKMSWELLIFVSSLMHNCPKSSRNTLDLYFDGFTSGRHNCLALCGIMYFSIQNFRHKLLKLNCQSWLKLPRIYFLIVTDSSFLVDIKTRFQEFPPSTLILRSWRISDVPFSHNRTNPGSYFTS